jgi:hypothetical protein
LFLPANPKGQSRIQNEFEILKWLGKGAFGDVLKVIAIVFRIAFSGSTCWIWHSQTFIFWSVEMLIIFVASKLKL